MRAPGMTLFSGCRSSAGTPALRPDNSIDRPGPPSPVAALMCCLTWWCFGTSVLQGRRGGGDRCSNSSTFSWFYSTPARLCITCGVRGVLPELFPGLNAPQASSAISFVAMASLVIVALSLVVWGTHMFPSGVPQLDAVIVHGHHHADPPAHRQSRCSPGSATLWGGKFYG